MGYGFIMAGRGGGAERRGVGVARRGAGVPGWRGAESFRCGDYQHTHKEGSKFTSRMRYVLTDQNTTPAKKAYLINTFLANVSYANKQCNVL